MRPPTPSVSSVSRERSSGQRSSAAAASTAIRLCSSGIERSPLRRPASTCATRTPASPAASVPATRRVRVAEDERPVGPLLLERGCDRRPHRLGVGGVQVEPVARLGQPELRVEDVGELRIPVLAGVETDLLDPGLAQRGGDRTGLDELRTVADDGEDLHSRRGYNDRPFGPLAQLVEQGTLNPKVAGSIPARPTRDRHALPQHASPSANGQRDALASGNSNPTSSGSWWTRSARASGEFPARAEDAAGARKSQAGALQPAGEPALCVGKGSYRSSRWRTRCAGTASTPIARFARPKPRARTGSSLGLALANPVRFVQTATSTTRTGGLSNEQRDGAARDRLRVSTMPSVGLSSSGRTTSSLSAT